jgi:SAM-dependent methyltransferase
MKGTADEVRNMVADTYGEWVAATPAEEPCCGSHPAPKGAVVELAGYSTEELAALPAGAVANSFGCGNPGAFAGLETGDVVLDLGSGAGIDLFLAAAKVGPTGRVIGVDMTDEMIARANSNITAGGYTNVEVRKGIIEELPLEDASVDWVISNCVINLSPEKPRVFAEIARVLKPGGRMLVSDIVARDLPEELRSLPAFYTSCAGGAISEEGYLAGLSAAGLIDAQVWDRLIYDAAQLEAFASSVGEDAACGCGGGGGISPVIRQYARTLEGKVWSAKIFAQKRL